MESTENEPVLNVDETNSGQELTEGAGESLENNEEVVSEEESNDDFKIDSFDPKAFSAQEEKEEGEEKEVEEEEDDTPAWPDLEEVNDDVNDSEEEVGEDNIVNNDSEADSETNSDEDYYTEEVTQDHFKSFTNQLGLEAENIEELKEVLNNIVKENNKLREQPKNVESNKRLDDLNNFLKLEDELLVRKSFEADGLKEDKLDYAIDRLLDTGLIEVEALKIRNNIDKAIKTESQNVINKREQESAKQEQDHTEAVESFGNYMQGIDTLFSFKITGNPDKLPEVRKSHTEYVTSGKYLKEITESEKNLAESSWLWRNRDVLKNALVNNGRQNGRKEILDKIGIPDKRKPQRFTNPTDTGDFDPAKFLK